MKALALLLLWTWTGAPPAEPGSPRETPGGLLASITAFALEEGVRPWAKPLREVDADLIRDLLDRGVLSDHPASWAVAAGEEEDV